MQRRLPVSILLVTVVTLASGCASQKSWSYHSEPQGTSPMIVNKSVAVPAFTDARVNENKNMLMMCEIPLVPFGWAEYQTPEGAQMHLTSALWLWRPTEDFAKAAAEELNASRIFKEAFFTSRASEGDLIFQGNINSTRYGASMYTYLLGFEGPLFWIFCLPVGKARNTLDVSFVLKDPKSEKVLWEKTYQREKGGMSILYNLRPDFYYPDLLKEIMLEAVGDLRTAVPTFAP